jgi:hypothetical protein
MFSLPTDPGIDEITEAQIWLRARLLASNAVVAEFPTYIGSHPAPRALTTYPILTLDPQPPTPDTNVVGVGILWANIPFIIRGIVDGNDQMRLSAGVAAVHNALHQQSGTTANAQVWCYRHKPFYMYELSDGISYIHKGGIYFCQVRPLYP